MRYSCWITSKGRVQMWLNLYKTVIHHRKTFLLINKTLKCSCLVRKCALNQFVHGTGPHIYTHLNIWATKFVWIRIKTIFSSLPSVQFGSVGVFFYCFSYTEVQLGHQTWPRAKGRPSFIENSKKSFNPSITIDPCL